MGSTGFTFLSTGRPPWYDNAGSIQQPLIIGVAGGSASGKTTVCEKLLHSLAVKWVVVVSQDSFYKPLTKEQLKTVGEYNFDHPDAFDLDLMLSTLKKFKEGKNVRIPIYDYKTHRRLNSTRTIYGADVILFEGILVLHYPQLRELLDVRIFVETDSDIRLARRIRRDTVERGRDCASILNQYEKFVKPAYDLYINPSKVHADIIIPRGADNTVAIELIRQMIQSKLSARGYQFNMSESASGLTELPSNIRILPSTNQIRAMHTIIRDKDTQRDDFVFYTDRLIRLIVEEALANLPCSNIDVVTPVGAVYHGISYESKICGVSILRAGEVMEVGLKQVCKDIPFGKILIQKVNKGPQLFYAELPPQLAGKKVLLLEPTVATAGSIIMAVRVLLDHGVAQENIICLSLIGSKRGLQMLSMTYPGVSIVVSEVDEDVDSEGNILPGIGDFGDRYFGT